MLDLKFSQRWLVHTDFWDATPQYGRNLHQRKWKEEVAGSSKTWYISTRSQSVTTKKYSSFYRIFLNTNCNTESLYQVTAVKLKSKKLHMAHWHVQANNKQNEHIKGARFTGRLCSQETNTYSIYSYKVHTFLSKNSILEVTWCHICEQCFSQYNFTFWGQEQYSCITLRSRISISLTYFITSFYPAVLVSCFLMFYILSNFSQFSVATFTHDHTHYT